MAKDNGPTAPVRLVRDTWIGEERLRVDGKVIEVPTDVARKLIDAGVAERADPLPGEPAPVAEQPVE